MVLMVSQVNEDEWESQAVLPQPSIPTISVVPNNALAKRRLAPLVDQEGKDLPETLEVTERPENLDEQETKDLEDLLGILDETENLDNPAGPELLVNNDQLVKEIPVSLESPAAQDPMAHLVDLATLAETATLAAKEPQEILEVKDSPVVLASLADQVPTVVPADEDHVITVHQLVWLLATKGSAIVSLAFTHHLRSSNMQESTGTWLKSYIGFSILIDCRNIEYW
jgi:hypothetical protein